jgi:hypothetical protein
MASLTSTYSRVCASPVGDARRKRASNPSGNAWVLHSSTLLTTTAVSTGFTLAEANVHNASALPTAPALVPSHVCVAHSTLQSGGDCDWNSRRQVQNAQLMADRAEDAELSVARQVQPLSFAAVCLSFAVIRTEKSSRKHQHIVCDAMPVLATCFLCRYGGK